MRSRLLKEWFDSRHFAVRNKRGVKTYVRATGESAINLTVSFVAASAWVSGWAVLSDFQSLSDHVYLAFSFGAPRSSGGLGSSSDGPRIVPPRWSLKSFDEERLAECLAADSWRRANFDPRKKRPSRWRGGSGTIYVASRIRA